MDILSVARTKMANERTLLAYISTALGFLATGVALLEFVLGKELIVLAYFLLALVPLLLIVGIVRYVHVNRLISAKVCIGNTAECQKHDTE